MELRPHEGQSARAQGATAGLAGSAVLKLARAATMSTAENERPEHSERRASYRCPVDGPRRAARLRVAGCDVAATIVDESTGGIGVEGRAPSGEHVRR